MMGGIGLETIGGTPNGLLYKGFLYWNTFFGSSSVVGIFLGSQSEFIGTSGLRGGSTCPGEEVDLHVQGEEVDFPSWD